LVDKDKRIKGKMVSSDNKYWTKKPTEREFVDCCNEFWNVSAYVAKGIKKDLKIPRIFR
jgi:aminoglycoside 6-adenylyltransferase